ncbi:AAA family ATPase [Pseudomonas cichorii]|nr:AAA family ATPase [Pseudomonas cichorii]MBX8587149.1 AAA family ATPase [Pseudomonas cichorii]
MKVKKMSLRNYRGLENFEIKFDKRMTVLIGENGCGKSSVVAAIRLLLWSYVRAFGKDVRRGAPPTIRYEDIYFNGKSFQFPCSVEGQIYFDDDILLNDDWEQDEEGNDLVFDLNIIGCTLRGERKRIKWDGRWVTETHALSKGLDVLFEAFDRPLGHKASTTDLHVIACYGTNRLWKKKIRYRPAPEHIPRAAGYDGAVDLTKNFIGFETFIAHILSYVVTNISDRQEVGALWLGVAKAVRLVTEWDIILPKEGSSDILYRRGKSAGLKISQLGDGVRCMIGLVSDLACRCALLNPHYGQHASQKTSGVVLIDEIDLHLHPSWQQTIVTQMQQAFPEIQFIITTHSPQVLSTVHRDNIRTLNVDTYGRVTASKPFVQFYGEPSGDVLQGLMLVDPQPPVPEKSDLQRLTALVDQGLYDDIEASNLMHELELSLGEKHPQLQRLRRSTTRQRVLRK